jgi:hypothetical protein
MVYKENFVMNKAPCKDCHERHERCHSTCQKYIQWKSKEKEIYDKRSKEMKEQSDVINFYIKSVQRTKKRVHFF